MKNLNIVIITGLSGSGKSTAIDALEDAGFFCVDNLPVLLLPKFLELHGSSISEVQKLAFGMDLRQEGFVENYTEVFRALGARGYHMESFFLECSEEVLVKRFSETRRQHPVSGGGDLLDVIRSERRQLRGLKRMADRVIDTSHMTVHQLKDLVIRHALGGVRPKRMRISILSFGFKHGIPLEADLVVDVRFIPNPYFVPHLKNLDGRDHRVREFVAKWDDTGKFLQKYLSLIQYLIPLYEREGRSYLTIGVGCTGGRHRSVVIAEDMFERLRGGEREVRLKHRDMELPV
ncbi:MAG: RNase adapter RapZ [Deltaproteobacteria bacterium]|nr:RNase adapter RapZ [Deltaproteobacteria bacterium]MBW2048312.1 RNase adapter RapZ [Deltaproteobacteria bacterium]MBW2110353.1 RNase adapter RapZ [Deltaproteobacteria bacterium]MBW2353040.1 RNase adapter RapZ [Deltaproteobacteria bacterium]HDZ90619.1 RNase adapter RapZ [Deltaproteobacteria bacterium]